MSKWEYELIALEKKFMPLKIRLNEHGAEGWELCGFLDLTDNMAEIYAVFKKEK